MPYIKQDRRRELIVYPGKHKPETSGELNYLLTKVINDFATFHGHSYQTFNDIVGALEGAKLEFYRRIVAPYEDKKIEENGDVY